MGIKGIYKEIGPGQRVALCRLAVDHLQQTGRPLRVAIDFAIWSFQAQAARGGANPAIRTLFYRLVRLLSLTVIPIFVFDGPNKPAFKRGKRSRGPGDTVSVAMAKRLFKLFGFATHDAPGEAEAECALLQQHGVVDAVLSEDVDTIMFGCTRTLRNWSSEGTKKAKTPTHISVYDVAELRQGETGLDREGMVLVALMSGGDYIPEGVPGCGVKVACEAAKAGFGRRLCRIKRSDPEALREWKEDLTRELRTNESKFFRVKHKALTIPEDFPNIEVLRYYTHPVVSQAATVERLKREFPYKQEIDIVGLREFTAQTFDWTFKIGAVKFIKVFALGLLVQGLMSLSNQDLDSNDMTARAEIESKLIKAIKSTRKHTSTDATPELRVSFIPNDIVGVDLDAEEDEVESTYGRSGLALNSDDEEEEQLEDGEAQSRSGLKKVFDPLQPDLAWIPETAAKLGVPLMVEDWEACQRNKQLAKGKKAPAKRSRKLASDMPDGALDRYVRSSKPTSTAPLSKEVGIPAVLPSGSQPLSLQQTVTKSTIFAVRDAHGGVAASTMRKQTEVSKGNANPPPSRPSLDINPWTIVSSQTTPKTSRTRSNLETIFISSSPGAPSPPPATAPAAVDSKDFQDAQSSALQPTDNNSQKLSFVHNSFSSPTSSPPASMKWPAETSCSPRNHKRTSEETTIKPAAKRTQRLKAARNASPTRRPARSSQGARKAAQPTIKSFSRLGKKDVAAASLAKPSRASFDSASDSESDDLEDISNIGQPKLSERSRKQAPPPLQERRPNPAPSHHTTPIQPPKSKTMISAQPITIPSSPPLPSPSPFRSKSKTTRLYIPRTSDAGFGYFREVEVTRDEADRMMRDEAESAQRAGRPGGRRMWRESEVSIVDLTGDE
ncbi:unnamed protein product [Discula destructiva]